MATQTQKSRTQETGPALPERNVGGDLLSHTLTSAVPSALEGLASGFGMGPGVTPPPQPPTTLFKNRQGTPIFPARASHTTPKGVTVVMCSGSHSGCKQRVVVKPSAY